MTILLQDKSQLLNNNQKTSYIFESYNITVVRNIENTITDIYAQNNSFDMPMIYTVVNSKGNVIDFEIDFETFDFIFSKDDLNYSISIQEAITVVAEMRKLLNK